MTKSIFKNLLVYLKQLLIDNKYLDLTQLIMEYITWLCYSIINFNKDYNKYLDVLNQCLLFLLKKQYDQLYDYIEEMTIYIDLSMDEEEY